MFMIYGFVAINSTTSAPANFLSCNLSDIPEFPTFTSISTLNSFGFLMYSRSGDLSITPAVANRNGNNVTLTNISIENPYSYAIQTCITYSNWA